MILISASDNNSWRHYRLRALATIRAWAYALRTCSDATLGRDTKLAPVQGISRRFPSPNPHVRSTQVSDGNPSGVLYHCPGLRRSPAILRRWISRFRAETVHCAADPGEVDVIS